MLLGLVLLTLLFSGSGEALGISADDPVDPEAAEAPAVSDEAPVKKIKMYVENWKFRPDTIRVKKGTRVLIEFVSRDASHSFVLKAYKLKVPLPEGKTDKVEFVADKVGTFSWRCGRPCGNGCAKMRGQLIVEE